MKTKHTFIKGKDGITIYLEGHAYTVNSKHANYEAILQALKKGKKAKKIIALMDTKKAVEGYCKGYVEIKKGVLFYKGEELHNSLTLKILQMMEEGFSIEPMVNFLVKLQKNPSYNSRQNVYTFIEHHNMPITPEGNIIMYKSVTSGYMDHHTRKISNKIGERVTMDRTLIDDNPNTHCSRGLHASNRKYAEGFGCGGHLMVVEVSPEHIVACANDCGHQKIRTCEYLVIGEVDRHAQNGIDAFNKKSVCDNK